jgi:hypothetical protein
VGATLDAAIDEVLETISDEQRVEPRFYPNNYPAWNEFFRHRYKWELAAYEGPPSPPVRNNAVGRHRWWSAPGRTLKNMLAHIEGWQLPRPWDVAVAGAFPVAPPRKLVDATTDGIPLVRVGIEVGIPLVQVGIDAEDGEEGAGVGTADQRAQWRRPHHPRGDAHLVATGMRP